MNTKTENIIPVQFSRADEEDAAPKADRPAGRKPFVEPAVSFPIDVLEATTFFQLTDSGTTT